MENPAGSSGPLYGCGVLQENREKKPEVCRSVGTYVHGSGSPTPHPAARRRGAPGRGGRGRRWSGPVDARSCCGCDGQWRTGGGVLVLLSLLVPLVVGYMTEVVPGGCQRLRGERRVRLWPPALDVPEGAAAGWPGGPSDRDLRGCGAGAPGPLVVGGAERGLRSSLRSARCAQGHGSPCRPAMAVRAERSWCSAEGAGGRPASR